MHSSFVTSARTYQVGSRRTDFRGILYWRILLKFVEIYSTVVKIGQKYGALCIKNCVRVVLFTAMYMYSSSTTKKKADCCIFLATMIIPFLGNNGYTFPWQQWSYLSLATIVIPTQQNCLALQAFHTLLLILHLI